MKSLLTPALILSAFGFLFIAGCSDNKTDFDGSRRIHDVTIDSHLRAVQSCDDLQEVRVDMITNGILDNYRWYGYDYDDMIIEDGAEPPMAAPGAGSDDMANHDGGVPRDYTDTNLQEFGVDEADRFKTDGQWVYTVGGDQKIHIYNIDNVQKPAEVGELPLRGSGATLFLQKDQLIVLSYVYGSRSVTVCPEGEDTCKLVVEASPDNTGRDYPQPEEPPIAGASGEDQEDITKRLEGTRVEIYDVKDPTDPTRVRSIIVEGQPITTRVIDGTLYLVQSSYLSSSYYRWRSIVQELDLDDRLDRDPQVRAAQLDDLRDEIREKVRLRIGSEKWDILPAYQTEDGALHAALDCGDLYTPVSTSSREEITSILAIDLSDKDAAPHGTGVLSSGWLVYGSPHAFYITRNSTAWSWIDNTMETEKTDIHVFAIENGHAQYTASGRIEGTIRDRFSMSEKDNRLRVVTTEQNNNWWFSRWSDDVPVGAPAPSPGVDVNPSSEPDETASSDDGDTMVPTPDDPTPAMRAVAAQTTPIQQNHLFVLEQNGNQLEVLGEIRGFAEGERIYGARFVGDMAYVVTFYQIDPLHSIDLSDPAHPVIRGELKIPGFSNYLQAINDDLLLGVGQNVVDGRSAGVQVSLFDVSDRENPTRLDVYTVSDESPNGWGGSSSAAEYDSHAFTWYPTLNLLTIPVQRWGQYDAHPSLLILHVDPAKGIELVGEIERRIPICYEEYQCQDEWITPERAAFVDGDLVVYGNAEISFWGLDNLETPYDAFVTPLQYDYYWYPY